MVLNYLHVQQMNKIKQKKDTLADDCFHFSIPMQQIFESCITGSSFSNSKNDKVRVHYEIECVQKIGN